MHKMKAAITLILVTLVVIFAIQNAAILEIQFLFWGFSAPRLLLVIILLVIGFLLGLLFSNFFTIKWRK